MATENTSEETVFMTLKVLALWAVNYIASNYDKLAGRTFITLSILYLAWRWHRDWKRSKKEDNA